MYVEFRLSVSSLGFVSFNFNLLLISFDNDVFPFSLALCGSCRDDPQYLRYGTSGEDILDLHAGSYRSVLGSLVKHYNELCSPKQNQAPDVHPVEPHCYGAQRLQRLVPGTKLVKPGSKPYTGHPV